MFSFWKEEFIYISIRYLRNLKPCLIYFDSLFLVLIDGGMYVLTYEM